MFLEYYEVRGRREVCPFDKIATSSNTNIKVEVLNRHFKRGVQILVLDCKKNNITFFISITMFYGTDTVGY